jgi:transposase-like protein
MVSERYRSRLTASIQEELIKQFVCGATARSAAEVVGAKRQTAMLYFHKLREMIVAKLAEEEPWLCVEVEVDESSFGSDAPDVSEFRHERVNHSETFVDARNHINGIENFWNQAK